MAVAQALIIALGGNPNTGKSTIFNGLTGLKQHTGNWPGKTVLQARGQYCYQGQLYELVDLPGTYSLLAHSPEEEVARDFLCFGQPAATVIVVDVTCLERNLNLVLQVTEITPKVVVCANLMDEARRQKLRLDLPLLEKELGVPVIPTTGTTKAGLPQLKDAIARVANGQLQPQPLPLQYADSLEKQISALLPYLDYVPPEVSKRWVALRLLNGDLSVLKKMGARS